MIEVHDKPDQPDCSTIEARSNLSISLDRLATVFLGLSAVTLLVALGPLIMGLWIIMVIAIVHLLIVGWCLRIAWRGHWVRELLSVGPEDLTVDHYDVRARSKSTWPVAWVKVTIELDRMGEERVFLSCQGRRQQLGAFLPVDERLELARILNERLRPLSAWGARNQPQVS